MALPSKTIVLVVEDDAELRALYRTALRLAGYAVVAVEDGFDALRFSEQTIPAAVVLDLGLPRVAGGDVQRELAAQAHTAHVPIIVVTGHTGTINEQQYACVLRKPIHAHELVAAVERCLAARKRRDDGKENDRLPPRALKRRALRLRAWSTP